MKKRRDSSNIHIPIKNKLIYEKHIHHLMVYMSVWCVIEYGNEARNYNQEET